MPRLTVIEAGRLVDGTGAEPIEAARMVVEGEQFLKRSEDGTVSPVSFGSDGIAISADGYLYVTANQLYRQPAFRGGKDERRRPYALFRTRIDAGPVTLR